MIKLMLWFLVAFVLCLLSENIKTALFVSETYPVTLGDYRGCRLREATDKNIWTLEAVTAGRRRRYGNTLHGWYFSQNAG
jgi:hypothetical protein